MKLQVFPTTSRTSIVLPDEIDGLQLTHDLVHQTVITETANSRSSHGHTKTRGEVRGGGRKPWKQKGTGRARQSSIRSPIWVGGGITFGPRSIKNFSKSLPWMMRARAFQMVVTKQLLDGRVRVIDAWQFKAVKTKAATEFLQQLPDLGKKVLILIDTLNADVILPLQNLSFITLRTVDSVRTADLLAADSLVMDTQTFAKLSKRAFGTEPEIVTDKAEKKAEAAGEEPQ